MGRYVFNVASAFLSGATSSQQQQQQQQKSTPLHHCYHHPRPHHHHHHHYPMMDRTTNGILPTLTTRQTGNMRLRAIHSSSKDENDLPNNNNNNNNNKTTNSIIYYDDIESDFLPLLREDSDDSMSSSYSTTSIITPTPTNQNNTTTKGHAVNNNNNSNNLEVPALSILLLNGVAILWGTQHAVIKMVVEDTHQADTFTLLRFALAALIASPYTPRLPSLFRNTTTTNSSYYGDDDTNKRQRSNEHSIKAWRWGAEMGFWMFLGFSFQAIGLESTTAQRSGFLLYLNVKFVPFFARLLLGREISLPTWVSALTAFVGTALLATDGGGGGSAALSFNEGDWWTIAAAASSAMFILRLEAASNQVPESAELNAACLWVVSLLSVIWVFSTGNGTGADDVSILASLVAKLEGLKGIALGHPWEILYLGGVTTALANYIQTRAQKDVSPERASVIYSLDPVYGAFFSWFLLGESLGGAQAWVGAGLITLAAATNAFLDFGKHTNNNNPPSSYDEVAP